MSRQFRVAVIGAGIGAAHVEAYGANAALYQVAVVCDLDAARANKVAATAGAAVETSYDAVLARDDIDLVDICLPPNLHLAAIEQALQSRRHGYARSRWSVRCATWSASSVPPQLPAGPWYRFTSTAMATGWRGCAG